MQRARPVGLWVLCGNLETEANRSIQSGQSGGHASVFLSAASSDAIFVCPPGVVLLAQLVTIGLATSTDRVLYKPHKHRGVSQGSFESVVEPQ